jgi:hypothetical protein
MKRNLFLVAFSLSLFLLPACAQVNAQNPGAAWTTYQAANDTLVNPNFPSYSFEYPAYWEIQEGTNHISFASEARLLTDPPEAMKAGQILVGLSLHAGMAAEEMVTGYTSTLEDLFQFEEPSAMRLNGSPAVYQRGMHRETSDASVTIAVDMGQDTRGLLTARMPGQELEKWEEILFKMAASLQVDR